MIFRIVKIAGFSIAALVVGLFGLSLFFSDLGPGETMFSRFATAVIIYFVAGLLIGFFNPKVWLLAGVVGWGGVILGLSGLARGENPVLSLLMVVLSLGPSLLGGFLSSYAAKRLSSRKNS